MLNHLRGAFFFNSSTAHGTLTHLRGVDLIRYHLLHVALSKRFREHKIIVNAILYPWCDCFETLAKYKIIQWPRAFYTPKTQTSRVIAHSLIFAAPMGFIRSVWLKSLLTEITQRPRALHCVRYSLTFAASVRFCILGFTTSSSFEEHWELRAYSHSRCQFNSVSSPSRRPEIDVIRAHSTRSEHEQPWI